MAFFSKIKNKTKPTEGIIEHLPDPKYTSYNWMVLTEPPTLEEYETGAFVPMSVACFMEREDANKFASDLARKGQEATVWHMNWERRFEPKPK